MSLSAGVRLGPYEILAPLGAGGMGEVYRARDTRLDRTVALKVLPSHLAADPDRRQRFEREAKAISALNHPHICVLHDVGRHDGVDFLVMEYVEGEALDDRLRRGALPLDHVLRYGAQIAQGLDRAHRRGIMHRDLKPGNVMLTRDGAKLLDFGLAKIRAGNAPASESVSALPTEEKPLTTEGSLLGTFQYMAPEQLEGKEPDARTDIFAFGALLYEMATGQRAFSGKTQASLIAAILSSDPPPISRQQPLTPPGLDRTVTKCLAKNPDDRWQSAGDLASELTWIATAGSHAGTAAATAPQRQFRRSTIWTTIVGAAALGLLVGYYIPRQSSDMEAPRQVRFQIVPSEGALLPLLAPLAVSPAGEHIAFVTITPDGAALEVRSLTSLSVIRPAGPASLPFWSADSRQIGFFSQAALKKVELSGGAVQTICPVRGQFLGATWNAEGTIVFSDNGELFRVSAAGGEPTPLSKPDGDQTTRYWPHFLPDGRRFLYLARSFDAAGASGPGGSSEKREIFVGSLDSAEHRRITASDHNAAYSPTGHLVFVRGDVLMSQRFDAATLELAGEPFTVAQQILVISSTASSLPGAAYSISANGVLAWRTGGSPVTRLTWVDRSGKTLGTIGDPGLYTNPALSRDEGSLAVALRDPATRTRDVWIFDLARGSRTRLTFDPADDTNPTWSPDGLQIAFTSDRRGRREIYQKAANGSSGEVVLLASRDATQNVEDWSADGTFMLFNRGGGEQTPDLYILPLSPGMNRQPLPIATSRFGEQQGQIAPDSRWVAYTSNESGRAEVYVKRVPSDGVSDQAKWQVTTAGGTEPRWRQDGNELFYFSRSNLMAVEVRTDTDSFKAGNPQLLFASPPAVTGRNRFVVTGDGRRFLINTVVDEERPSPINVLVNWSAPNR